MEESGPSILKFVERRQHRRLERDFDVDAVVMSGSKTSNQFTGKILNISKEGVAVFIPNTEIEGGDRLLFTIYVDDDNSMCDGKVIWKKEIKGQLIYGVKILNWTYMDSGLKHNLRHS